MNKQLKKQKSGSTECEHGVKYLISTEKNVLWTTCVKCSGKPASPEWEKYVKTWSEQGRTEEQIYAVRNFMTGQGFIMLKDFKQSLYELIKEKMPKKHLTPHPKFSEYNKALDDVTKALSEIFEH